MICLLIYLILCIIQELLDAIYNYLEERGVDEKFAAQVVTFYRNFERQNYVQGFLKGLQKFLQTQWILMNSS